MAEERGVAFVDAPVSGTKKPAEEGELAGGPASGPRDALERVKPIFDAVGREDGRARAGGGGAAPQARA